MNRNILQISLVCTLISTVANGTVGPQKADLLSEPQITAHATALPAPKSSTAERSPSDYGFGAIQQDFKQTRIIAHLPPIVTPCPQDGSQPGPCGCPEVVATIDAGGTRARPMQTEDSYYDSYLSPQDGMVFIGVHLSSAAPSCGVTVPLLFNQGQGNAGIGVNDDVVISTNEVHFDEGETLKYVLVGINDIAAASDKVLQITLGSPSNAILGTANASTITIHKPLNVADRSSLTFGTKPGVLYTVMKYDKNDYGAAGPYCSPASSGCPEYMMIAHLAVDQEYSVEAHEEAGNPTHLYWVTNTPNEYKPHCFTSNPPIAPSACSGCNPFFWYHQDCQCPQLTAYSFATNLERDLTREASVPYYHIDHLAAFDEFINIADSGGARPVVIGAQGFISPSFSVIPSPEPAAGVTNPAKINYTFVFSAKAPSAVTVVPQLLVYDTEGSLCNTVTGSGLTIGTQLADYQFTINSPTAPSLDSYKNVAYARLKLTPAFGTVDIRNLENYRHHAAPNPYFPDGPNALLKDTFLCIGLPSAWSSAAIDVDGHQPNIVPSLDSTRNALVVPYQPSNFNLSPSNSNMYRWQIQDSHGRLVTLSGYLERTSATFADANARNFRNELPIGVWGLSSPFFHQLDKTCSSPNDNSGSTDVPNSTLEGLNATPYEFRGDPTYKFGDNGTFQFSTRFGNATLGSYYDWIVGAGLNYSTYKDLGINTIYGYHGPTFQYNPYFRTVSHRSRRQEVLNATTHYGMNAIVDAIEVADALDYHFTPYQTISPTSASNLIDKLISNTNPNGAYGNQVLGYYLRDEPPYRFMWDMALYNRILQSHGFDSFETMQFQGPFNDTLSYPTADMLDKYDNYIKTANAKVFMHEIDTYPVPGGKNVHLGNLGFGPSRWRFMEVTEKLKKRLLQTTVSGPGTPAWGVAQAWGVDDYRQPFYSEVRCMSWLMLAAGMKGILYFGSAGIGFINNGYGRTPFPGVSNSDLGIDQGKKTTSICVFQPASGPPTSYGETFTLTDSATNTYVAIDKINGNPTTMYDSVHDFSSDLNTTRTFTFDGQQFSKTTKQLLLEIEPYYDGVNPFTHLANASCQIETAGQPGSSSIISGWSGGGSNLSPLNSVGNSMYPVHAYVRWFADATHPNWYYLSIVNLDCAQSSAVTIDIDSTKAQLQEAIDIKNPSVSAIGTGNTLHTGTLAPGEGTLLLVRYSLPCVTTTYDETGFSIPTSGWQTSAIDSGPEWDSAWAGMYPSMDAADPSYLPSPDDVNVSAATGEVRTNVSASLARSRIAGWTKPGAIAYDSVGANNFVRAKFYVYSPDATTNDAVNAIPNFRVRLDNEAAVVCWANFLYGQTGISGVTNQHPGYESNETLYATFNDPTKESVLNKSIAPSNSPQKPSLYRLDFDPIDVPAASGSNIQASFESYSTETPAHRSLALTQFTIGTYPAAGENDGILLFSYDKNTGLQNGELTVDSGALNVDNDFRAGIRPTIDVTSTAYLGTVTNAGTGYGYFIDTTNVPTNKEGAAIFTVHPTSNAKRPRISENKLYRAHFYAASFMPATTTNGSARQGDIRFRMQTGGGEANYFLELAGPFANSTAARHVIGAQAIPSVSCQNPSTRYDYSIDLNFLGQHHYFGSWYTVLMSSPLNVDIRRDAGNVLNTPLLSQPGYGSTQNSYRDIFVGVDGIQMPTTLRIPPDASDPNAYLPFWDVNKASVYVTHVDLYEQEEPCDGGYAY